jgi:hypothetical protein
MRTIAMLLAIFYGLAIVVWLCVVVPVILGAISAFLAPRRTRRHLPPLLLAALFAYYPVPSYWGGFSCAQVTSAGGFVAWAEDWHCSGSR